VAAKKQQLTQHFMRPGEGVVMGIVRHDKVASGGVVSQTVAVDFSSAQVPDRRYAADVGVVLMSDNMIRLIFGQTKPLGKGLMTLLVIHIPYQAARTFLHSMNELAELARSFMKQYKVGESSLLELMNQDEPAQTATVESNIILAAFSGREACMDFYHSSPFARKGFGISGKFFAEPTVRVTLGLPLLMAIYDWLKSHKGELPADELEGTL
jgi:hypothetical protein